MLNADTIYWYPMRVTYGREKQVKTFLDGETIEAFLPMTTRVWRDGKRVRHEEVPAISNLIFVHSTRSIISNLKHTRRDAEPLRYMTRPAAATPDAPREIIIVPDKQMDNFIKVASGPEEQRTFLSADDLRGHAGAHVVIKSGPFAGVEGVIKRIHGNKRVVVELEGIGGVCVNFVPKDFVVENKI